MPTLLKKLTDTITRQEGTQSEGEEGGTIRKGARGI
jgi:hypothetical protein